jgi:hypothetical protein
MLMFGEDNEYCHDGPKILHEPIDDVDDVKALHADIDHFPSFLAPVIYYGQ